MRYIKFAGFFAVLAFLLAGCMANDVMVKRQAETDAKVEHLFQLTGTAEVRYNDLATRLSSIEEKEPSRAATMQEMQDKIRGLTDLTRKLQTRLALMDVVAPSKVELVNPEPVRGKETGPPSQYVKAFGLYSTNQFAAAIEAFERFIKESPASEYSPNAWYWIGECYYSMNQYQKALVAFQKVVDGWPRHAKSPDALLKSGYSYSAIKQPDKAKASFERIIRSYPASPATIKARERLM